jgi:protein gp37/ParB-like chromosome segregation protein Spo0J
VATSSTKLGTYKIHPVADLFPLLDDAALNALAEDIECNGQLEPIVLTPDGTTIVDGRNRWRACMKARVDPRFRELGKHYHEEAIIRFIIGKNIVRRSLDVGQRAKVVLAAAPYLEAAAKERQLTGKKNLVPTSVQGRAPRVVDQLAVLANVAPSTIQQIKTVEKVSPQLADQVLAGTISLNAAYKEVRSKPKADDKTTRSGRSTIMTLVTHDGQEVRYKRPTSKPTFNKTNDQISWAAWSWNPVTGCLHGCKYCYARELAMRESYREFYPVGFTPLFHPERLNAPADTAVPRDVNRDSRLRRVFVCSMADLYGKWVPDDWIKQVHQSCIANPQWDYLMLTKFPKRYVGLELPKTAWLGTSVDEQKRVRLAEEAFREIKNVRVKWLSLEPLLADLQFSDLSMFDWIVIGAQSATEQPDGVVPAFAPPFKWVSRLVGQAHEAGCKVYLKPNLLGSPNPQSPGMQLPQEEPVQLNGRVPEQHELMFTSEYDQRT